MRPDRSRLEAAWRSLGGRDPEAAWQRVNCSYAQPWRHYHSHQHLRECLEAVGGSTDPRVELALWFHDVVYLPWASGNEQKSAEIFRRLAEADGIPDDAVREIEEAILATDHGTGISDAISDQVVDADLWILGSVVGRYREYARQVRREYFFVPGPLYRKSRARVLRAFLDQPFIYRSEARRRSREDRARQNLQSELERLGGVYER